MTDAQKHAARLRKMIYELPFYAGENAALLAGAEALESQGEWRVGVCNGQGYMIPVGREDEWQTWCDNREAGEYTSIVPEWAVAVPDDVVITGWRKA